MPGLKGMPGSKRLARLSLTQTAQGCAAGDGQQKSESKAVHGSG